MFNEELINKRIILRVGLAVVSSGQSIRRRPKMKMTKSPKNKNSDTWLKTVFVLIVIALPGTAFSTVGLACHKGQPHGKDATATSDPGGGAIQALVKS
jgi:hypothetical protein